MAEYPHDKLNPSEAILILWERESAEAFHKRWPAYNPNSDEGTQWYLLTADGLQQVTKSVEWEQFLAAWSDDGSRLLVEDGWGEIVPAEFSPPLGVAVEYRQALEFPRHGISYNDGI